MEWYRLLNEKNIPLSCLTVVSSSLSFFYVSLMLMRTAGSSQFLCLCGFRWLSRGLLVFSADHPSVSTKHSCSFSGAEVVRTVICNLGTWHLSYLVLPHGGGVSFFKTTCEALMPVAPMLIMASCFQEIMQFL